MAVGFGYTVRVTSSCAVPQDSLVVVILRVTVPIPDTLTVEVGEEGSVTVALAVPVEPTCVHAEVPPLAVPAKVNDVGPEGAVWHFASSGPAVAVGLATTVTVASSEDSQPASFSTV